MLFLVNLCWGRGNWAKIPNTRVGKLSKGKSKMSNSPGLDRPPTLGLNINRCIRSTRVKESLPSSMDSDLEAFSHNPTDGSFAPLAFQLSANANCLNLLFLSY